MKRLTPRRQLWLLGLLGVLVCALNFRLGDLAVSVGLLSAPPPKILSFLVQMALLSSVYLAALLVLGRAEGENGRNLLSGILLFALLFRLPLVLQLPSALSSDLYRYLWDGRVQVAGKVNPYLYAPEDRHLAPLRDAQVYPQVNRKEDRTIYPPGAQILFLLASHAGVDSPSKLKLLGLGAELLSFLLLALILQEVGLPPSRVLIYAWNPLVLYELAYSGHLDVFVIPPLLGFLYLSLRGRFSAAGTALGIATSLKLVPALLLVAIPRGKRLRTILPFAMVVFSGYLAYAGAGTKILGFLPSYLSNPYEIFNPGLIQEGLFSLAGIFSLPPTWARYAFLGSLLVVLGFLAQRPPGGPNGVVYKSYVALSAYLVVIYPAFHPWYLCPLIALLCLIPSRAWIYFSLALPLSYLKYLSADGMMPGWVTWVEFAPLYALLAVEYVRARPYEEKVYFGGGKPGESVESQSRIASRFFQIDAWFSPASPHDLPARCSAHLPSES